MKHSEIQVGDTVEVRSVLKVEAVRQEADGVRLQFKNEKGTQSVVRLLPDDEVKLVDRPLPPLPTQGGSVVEINGKRWFLRKAQTPQSNDYWFSETGQSEYPKQLAAHAADSGGFEVLL